MNLEFELPKELSSIIKVIGVGGAGSNAVNHMFQKGIKGVNFIVANTDEQHLNDSPVKTKILLGPELTKGLGTGADPEIGKKATEESLAKLKEILGNNTRMLFIAAGMGKGTGTGGAPVIAKLAKEMGILTVAIITTPFSLLGRSAIEKANQGVENLKNHVDSILVISNDKIEEIYGDLKLSDAFALADDVLANAAKGISEIITGAGIHNTDFNDVNRVLTNGGMTIMGVGYAKGESRAKIALAEALESPLLTEHNIRGAKKALLNISYSKEFEVSMSDLKLILKGIQEAAMTDIDIIHGTSVVDTLGEEISVTVIVTGFDPDFKYTEASASATQTIELLSEPAVIHESQPVMIDEVENENTFNFEINDAPSTVINVDALDELDQNDSFISIMDVNNNQPIIDFGTQNNSFEHKVNRFDRFNADINTPINVMEKEIILDFSSEKSDTHISSNGNNLFSDGPSIKAIVD